MAPVPMEPAALLTDARWSLRRLAEAARALGLDDDGGRPRSAGLDSEHRRLLRLVLEFCDRLCDALRTAERRCQAAPDRRAALGAAQTLGALERIVWHPLEQVGDVLFRWVQRRPEADAWEVDYLGLEYQFDRRGAALVRDLLRLEALLSPAGPASRC